VVLSLGTGTEDNPISPIAPNFRGFITDGFIPRICRSFISSLDGEVTWKHLQNSLNEKSQPDHFRLNVPLQGKEPAIDDITCMDELRKSAQAVHSLGDYIDIATALLVSSFYFELTALPQLEGDFYKCHGTVRCRGRSDTIIKSLSNLHGRLEFATESELLGTLNPISDFCQLCHKYRKRVTFYIQHPKEIITLFLKTGGTRKCRKISGFPQCIEWFIQQQHLNAAFGTADHGCPGRLYCSACDSNDGMVRCNLLKRKGNSDQRHAYKKVCI
jgi:hypothetical protein